MCQKFVSLESSFNQVLISIYVLCKICTVLQQIFDIIFQLNRGLISRKTTSFTQLYKSKIYFVEFQWLNSYLHFRFVEYLVNFATGKLFHTIMILNLTFQKKLNMQGLHVILIHTTFKSQLWIKQQKGFSCILEFLIKRLDGTPFYVQNIQKFLFFSSIWYLYPPRGFL
ncbi:unnamed protein product [Paramecium pentaurelia]|uniref:Transmembrane protein n=1 Tax=Paramecium pentaurelia TaxID=43138 RepID=A0A8S1X1N8_9CILI|nr:unnamed protein product [Paramecium pentaurelia]